MAVALAVTAPEAQGVAGFGDVAAGRFFTSPVQWMVDNDITTGTSPTCFSPDDAVTRGQAAAFLWRMEGFVEGEPLHRFDDVVAAWQQVPVSWMAANGITTGTSPTTYSPDETLTRGQMAALLHRAAGEPTAPETTFPDVTRPWQLQAVGWLQAEGITTGTSATTFSPEDPVTRGQFAAFAYRWKGSPSVDVETRSPPCRSSGGGKADAIASVDWVGCWRAEDAVAANGATPADGGTVVRVPNCATGPSGIGTLGAMSHPSAPPTYRHAGAGTNPSIEFTFAGNTLLQTNGGSPWPSDALVDGDRFGVTLAWIGMMSDVESHDVKYLVSGLSYDHEAPQLIIEGEGPNRFAAYGGGNGEARSSTGTVRDGTIHGVIVFLSPDGSSSSVEVDGADLRPGQDSAMREDVLGLTLGNSFARGFSTTDHQFVFLGLSEGRLSEAERATFWGYVDRLRAG